MEVLTRLFVVFGVLITSQSSATASEICKQPCAVGLCDTMTCYNGQCNRYGSCVCDDCWSGNSCDQYNDHSPPRFLQKYYQSTLDAWAPPGYLVLSLDAADRDEKSCQKRDCACSQFYYKIEHGNRDGLFEIKETSGEIIANDRIAFHVGETYTMLVSVAPTGVYIETAKDYATVVIQINGMNDADDDVDHDDDDIQQYAAHHRVKRALPGVPDEVLFNMTKTGDFAGVSSLHIGDKVHFVLDIFFPLGTTDMVVELFTPDNDTTIMVVCDPQITYQGSNLVLLNGTVDPALDSKDGSLNYDRAVLELGLVDNTGVETTLTSSNQLTVEWDVYMINNSQIVNAGTYWISAGAEYNNDTTVWVGQMSFTAVDDNFAPGSAPNYTESGPLTAEVGSSATFRLDLYIPDVSADLDFEVYSPNGTFDVMSICSVLVADTGDNYVCLPKEKLTFDLLPSTTQGNDAGVINVGTLTNTGTRDPANLWANNRVSLEWTLYVFDDALLVGQFYDIGYAVWLDNNLLTTDSMNVQIVNKLAPTVAGTPTFDFYAVDSGSVVVDDRVTFELEITVPSSSNHEFIIEVRHPLDASGARMEVCDIRARYNGINVPCLGFNKPVYNVTSTDNLVVWNMGRILNTGQRSEALVPLANKLILRMTSHVTNHIANVVSASLTTDVTVDYSNGQQWTGNANIIITDLTPPETANVTDLTFAASFASGSDQFRIHSSSEVKLDITTQPGQTYSPFTINTTLPVASGSAVLTFCDVRISNKGKNVPCVEPTFAYSSSTNGSDMDSVMVSLKHLSNLAPLGSAPTYADNFTVSFFVLVQNHASLATNGTALINMDTMFSPTQAWTSSLSLSGLNLPPVLYQGTGPHLVLTRTDQDDSNTTVSQGSTATYQLLLKTPPDSLDNYVITATVTAELSVCFLRMSSVGQSLPCMDRTTTPASYTVAPNGVTNTQGNMSFTASNIGSDALVADLSFDANSLLVEIVVLMPASAGAGPHDLTVDVNYGYAGGSTWSAVKVITMAAAPGNVITDLATIPAVDFALSPYMDSDYVWDNNVAKGQVIIFNLDITPTQASTNNILVTFHTPVNDTGSIEICSVHVIHIGKNIPCSNKQGYKSTYDSRPGSDYTDIATIDLGTVCQFPIITNDTVADKISIEVTVKVTSNNTVNYGDTLWFNATMKVNSDEIYIGQQSLLVHADAAINQTNHDSSLANLTLNVTSADLEWSPAGIYTVPIIITVPRDCSVRAVVNVTLPVVNTAVMTVRHIQVVSAGENLACLDKHPLTDFTPAYNSTQETTQNDIVTYDLGHIVNTGGTYRAGVYEDDDDDVTIAVEIQLADSIVNTNLSQHLIVVSAQIGDALLVENAPVVVNRDGTESPKLELQLAVNNSITYTAGSVVSLSGILQHTNLSTAEAHNVSIIFYVPSVIADIQLSQNNFTAAVVTNLSNSQAFKFEFDRLLFTDIASLTFDVTVAATAQSPGGALTDITLSAEIISNMIYRDNSIYPEGYQFTETMSTTSASFVLSVPATPGCVGTSLGMQDGRIQDCQLSGSSNSILGNLATAARPTATGWISGVHPASSTDYLQVYFGNVTQVTAIYMGLGDVNYANVTKYRVQHSDDGIQWHGIEDILTSYSGVPLVSSNTLLSQTEARYIRLVVLDTTSGPTARASMTVEFDGCTISSDITAVPERGILYLPGKAFFCNMEQVGENSRLCYRTTDDGGTWTGLGGEAAAILGYSGVESALFGLASDYSSFLLSRDDGDSWESIPETKYTEASLDLQWTNIVSVDWDDTNPIAIASATWTAKFDGIYISGVKRVDWDSCCTP